MAEMVNCLYLWQVGYKNSLESDKWKLEWIMNV
jgi:hypothetical protein